MGWLKRWIRSDPGEDLRGYEIDYESGFLKALAGAALSWVAVSAFSAVVVGLYLLLS